MLVLLDASVEEGGFSILGFFIAFPREWYDSEYDIDNTYSKEEAKTEEYDV